MKITKIQNYNNIPDKIRFKATSDENVYEISDKENISKKAKTLMQAMNAYIDKSWAEIKKEKHPFKDSPVFSYNSNKYNLFIKPIYAQTTPLLLIENYDGKFVEKILIDRNYPSKFRYEKTVVTDHGSATLKSYNSELEKDIHINLMVDDIICDTFPQIVPLKILKDYFPRNNFRKGSNHQWYLI